MGMKCEVKIPEQNESYKKSIVNFKKEWARIRIGENEDGYFQGELIEIAGREGIVKFYNGILLCLPVEYIRVLE